MNSLENNISEEARQLIYQDFPHKFVWHKDTKMWTKRQKGFSLGHIFFVPPTVGERFYLQTLLCVCQGPRSFIDLYTFQNVEYTTFKTPVVHMASSRITENGYCLTEASQIQSSQSLCQLFASMLLFCQLSAPENLWLEFHDNICDDLHVAVPNPMIDRIYDYELFLFNRILGESGYTLKHFPKMPIFQENWAHVNRNYLISEQLLYDFEYKLQSFHKHMYNI